MQKIKEIFWINYTKQLKSISSKFDFDWKTTNWPLHIWGWIVFDKKDISKIKWIIIWEAPWADEVKNSIPFIWKAWQNLKSNINNENILYITNSIKFRPIEKTDKGYKNRTPTQKETEFSSLFLKKELFYLENIGINKILLVWSKALDTMLFICKNSPSKILINKHKIDLKELKKLKTSEIVNKWFRFEIEWKIFDCYLIFHSSPLNYNRKERRKAIIEWIKIFEDSL